jgi:hypothetical protein
MFVPSLSWQNEHFYMQMAQKDYRFLTCSSRNFGESVTSGDPPPPPPRTGPPGLVAMDDTDATGLPAPENTYDTPLRFKLGGRPVLSAHLNVETAGFEPKRPEI